jgi:hypothetical protein
MVEAETKKLMSNVQLACIYDRVNFKLSKEKGINTTAKKNIIKLVKLQNLVAK